MLYILIDKYVKPILLINWEFFKFEELVKTIDLHVYRILNIHRDNKKKYKGVIILLEEKDNSLDIV